MQFSQKNLGITFQNIKCSNNFTIVKTNNNKLYIFGIFQHTKKEKDNFNILKIIHENKINIQRYFNFDCLPRKLSFSHLSINKNITKFACGQDHILAINANNLLFGLGDNKHGQLGLDKQDRLLQFSQICTKNPVVEVEAFHNHTFLIDINQGLWGTGYNYLCVLGLQEPNKNYYKFTKINIESVQQVSTNYSHTLALCNHDSNVTNWIYDVIGDKSQTTNLRLFSWGNNSYGQLAMKDYNARSQPTLSNTFIKFKKIKAGPKNSSGITLNGDLYLWGFNEFFKPEFNDGTSFTPIQSKQIFNQKHNEISKVKIEQNLCLFANENQELYLWGDIGNNINDFKLKLISDLEQKVQTFDIYGSNFCFATQNKLYYCLEQKFEGFVLEEYFHKSLNTKFNLYNNIFIDMILFNQNEKINQQNRRSKRQSSYSDRLLLNTNINRRSLEKPQNNYCAKEYLDQVFNNVYQEYKQIQIEEKELQEYQTKKIQYLKKLEILIWSRLVFLDFQNPNLFKQKVDKYLIYPPEYLLNKQAYIYIFSALNQDICNFIQLFQVNKEKKLMTNCQLMDIQQNILGINYQNLQNQMKHLQFFIQIFQFEWQENYNFDSLGCFYKSTDDNYLSCYILQKFIIQDFQLKAFHKNIYKKFKTKLTFNKNNQILLKSFDLKVFQDEYMQNDVQHTQKLREEVYNNHLKNIQVLMIILEQEIKSKQFKGIWLMALNFLRQTLENQQILQENEIDQLLFNIFFLPFYQILINKKQTKNFTIYQYIVDFFQSYFGNQIYRKKTNWSQKQDKDIVFKNQEFSQNKFFTLFNSMMQNQKQTSLKNIQISQMTSFQNSFLQTKIKHIQLTNQKIVLSLRQIYHITLLCKNAQKNSIIFKKFIKLLDKEFNYTLLDTFQQKDQKVGINIKQEKLQEDMHICQKCRMIGQKQFMQESQEIVNEYVTQNNNREETLKLFFIDLLLKQGIKLDSFLRKNNKIDIDFLDKLYKNSSTQDEKVFVERLKQYYYEIQGNKIQNLSLSELILSWKKEKNLLFFPEYFYVIMTKGLYQQMNDRQEYLQYLTDFSKILQIYQFKFLQPKIQQLQEFFDKKIQKIQLKLPLNRTTIVKNLQLGFANHQLFNVLIEKKNLVYRIFKYFKQFDTYKEINTKIDQNQKHNVYSNIIINFTDFEKLNIISIQNYLEQTQKNRDQNNIQIYIELNKDFDLKIFLESIDKKEQTIIREKFWTFPYIQIIQLFAQYFQENLQYYQEKDFLWKVDNLLKFYVQCLYKKSAFSVYNYCIENFRQLIRF